MLLNPYFLIISGLFLIIASSRLLSFKPVDILKFWMTFIGSFFKNSSILERRKANIQGLSLLQLLFLSGWVLLFMGIIRFFAEKLS
ncbi:hypothetical protein A2476_05440 [candidate division CPR3 bacterium RIFOXYC2_FULL_35_7]|nr:MAG: hypothetical protein A2476_05440 [candidate division CPR3 bacterium RIFOXYC2_FULL_35_7]